MADKRYADLHEHLKTRFPAVYVAPPEPSGLQRHDEMEGLVPYELEGW